MPSTKKKNSKAPATDDALVEKTAEQIQEEEDMPEHIRVVKEKWERENPGKRYKYKKGKKDMPTISDMLAHGSPEKKAGTMSWLELILYPTVLALLFFASFSIFLWIDPIKNSKYPKGRFSLNKMKSRVNPNVQRPDPVGATSQPERIVEKKEKEADYRKPDHAEL
mmetsp:Transcript_41007/g.85366  ORF Transcript_41007/g.85366 Transcript_41007/m.85366 type:complete len:166 (-) Transcript_41007:313-810(-)|eukprot:CAMPEP_0172472244 /NCGR_PEP_ID=MMETSP1065-20121228/68237_1 /TAXON_ID=265537 /ORGANISM="Amphiprora paludosa, Strain CCMP125" /LENGTH=165 /DNA_ID=CAMNT_0013230375 /DNA_START=97 /DNA_END=594 /DNA_ORIENTATION=+